MNLKGNITCLLSILILFWSVAAVSADEVILDNGDRLTGTVGSMAGDVLILDTGYSEPVKIKIKNIQMIHTNDTIDLQFKSGEAIKGIMKTDSDGTITVRSPETGETTVIQWDDVKAINPPPIEWKGNITIGANSQSGNTNRKGASVGVRASRKSDNDRITLRFLYNYAEEQDEVTARNTFGSLAYDYFLIKSWYASLGIELVNDKFRDLKLRTAVNAGLGYQIWDDPVKFLLFEAGVSYFSEDLYDGKDDDWFAARGAAEFKLVFFELITLSDYFTVSPSFEGGRVNLRNEAGLASALGADWSLKLLYIIEYDSEPPPDVKTTDEQWILALQYSF